MQKTIKIEFNGLASGTTASVKLEYLSSDDNEKLINSEVLQEVKELYNEANRFAEIKTAEKMLKKG